MSEYKVIVPNLDHRPDRWQWCRKVLLEQGVPPGKIERFSAYGVLEFRGYPDWEDRFRKALRDQFGPIPRYLDWKQLPEQRMGDWAWSRTYYSILTQIAGGTDTALVLVDDRSLEFDYNQVCRHLDILNREPFEPLAMIQYISYCNKRTNWILDLRDSDRLRDIPEMQYGLRGPGDAANLYTPLGARRHLDFIDAPKRDEDGMILRVRSKVPAGCGHISVADLRRGHPENITTAFAFCHDTRGCYSTPEAKIKKSAMPYCMNREDRCPPPGRVAKKTELGELPLPRVFDTPKKYKLDFFAYDDYLELATVVHPEMIFRNYGYRSSFLSSEHIEKRRNYGKEIFAQANNITTKGTHHE